MSDEDAVEFRGELESGRSGLKGLVTHASYLINLASEDPEILERSRAVLTENLRTSEMLGSRGVVVHVGSHKGAGLNKCLSRITKSLESALEAVDGACSIFLENTAGQGGSVGVTFAELRQVIEALDSNPRIGICLDTQHLFASGVSFATIPDADAVVDRLSGTFGIERLGCIHLNDSKVPLGSLRDRHENLGEGMIGAEALSNLISHPSLRQIPLVLETPGTGQGPSTRDVSRARQILKDGIRSRSGASCDE